LILSSFAADLGFDADGEMGSTLPMIRSSSGMSLRTTSPTLTGTGAPPGPAGAGFFERWRRSEDRHTNAHIGVAGLNGGRNALHFLEPLRVAGGAR